MTGWRCMKSGAALLPDASIASKDEKSGISDGAPLGTMQYF